MSDTQSTRTCEECGGPIKPTCKRFCSWSCKQSHQKVPLAERFRRGIGPTTETGCILWIAARSPGGYGIIPHAHGRNKGIGAHCVAYELAHGPVPKGMNVLHSCDNPPCVNELHLFLGTDAVNMEDKVAKNRQAKGESIGVSVLTNAIVLQIRDDYSSGRAKSQELATRYGVNKCTICRILARTTWKHI